MKFNFTKTKFPALFIFLFCCQLLQAQAPGMILKEGTSTGYVIKTLSDDNLIGLFDDQLIKMDQYGNNIWIADEYTNPWGYPTSYFAGDVFENADGSLTAFNRNSIYRFGADGSLTGSTSFVDDTSIVAICRVPSGYQMLLKYLASGAHHYLYRRIMDDGSVLWSYELAYSNYPIKTDMFSRGEQTQILIRMMDAGVMNGFRTILVDTMGTVLSDVSDNSISFYGDVFDNGEELILTQLDHYYDHLILTKMDYTNENIWSYSNYPESEDSTATLIQLPSGNIITAFESGSWLDENYFLQFHSSDGDDLFTTAAFLDGVHYKINDFLYDHINNALVFTGSKDYSEGFVLITDTLGNFVHMSVEGRVYEDLNTNGVYDDGEVTFHDVIVSSPPYYAVTNSEGYYSLFLPVEDTYAINASYPAYWDVMDPSAGYAATLDVTTAGDTLTGYDYRMSYTEPISDLVVSCYLEDWWYGYFIEGNVSLNNYGNQYATSGTVSMHFPSGLTVLSTDPPYDDLTDTIITWNFTDMDPYEHFGYYVDFDPFPDTSIISDALTIVIAEPITGDYVPEDNIDTLVGIISSSWDPNHKTVSPAGVTEEGCISPETEWLQYGIAFQNTGTAPAVNISIYDTLDESISFTTLQMLAASDNYTMHIIYPNIVRWDFENIYLPDSTSDLAGSNGFLQFRIKINEGTPEGTVIKNTAAIYFDFNPAVLTNTTITTLKEVAVVTVHDVKEVGIQSYPNPNDGRFVIDLSAMQVIEKNISLTIKNIAGEEIYTEQINTSENQHSIQLDKNVVSGTYMLELKSGENIYHQKVIVTR